VPKLCKRCGRYPRVPRTSRCGYCHRVENRISRLKNPVHAFLRAAKQGPCIDCGVKLPPEVMELDHVRGEKAFGLTYTLVRWRSLQEIEAEVAKCELRCPNCHRMRHYRERWDPLSPDFRA